MKILIKITFLFVFVLSLNISFAQNFSLNQLLDSALQNNYLLQSNKLNTNIKQTEIDKLKINYLPIVGASASFSYWNFLLPNKERLLGDNKTDFYNDITVYQTIYDFGQTKAEQAKIEQEILLNDEIQRQIRLTVIYGVANAYFSALSSEMEILAHQNSLEQLKNHLQYSQNLFDIGKVSSIDILKINVQISVEEKNLQKAQNDFLAQKIKLQNLCYLTNVDSLKIKNSAQTLFNQFENQLFISDTIYNNVIENHPLILVNNIKIDIEEKQQEIYKRQNRPELFGYGISNWEHGYLPFADNFNFNVGIGIRYTIPYWGGSGYRYNITKSNYVIEQLGVEKNQSFLEIKSEIDLVLNDIESIKQDIENQKKIIELATETINNASVKYQAGQGTIIDILDAQTILTDATIAYNKATILFLQSLVKLHYLSANEDYPF
ncbi:MAG: TolC family protein [Bacteroidia bacterium]|nr:TolC family protein [Bacteroidia bacterium]